MCYLSITFLNSIVSSSFPYLYSGKVGSLKINSEKVKITTVKGTRNGRLVWSGSFSYYLINLYLCQYCCLYTEVF